MRSCAVESGGGAVTAGFVFDPALPVFEGHFPGRPVLPGAFQIEMIVAAVEAATKRRYSIARITKAKFTRPLGPGEEVSE